MTYHAIAMKALDASQTHGSHLHPLHVAARAVLRETNMKGKAINSPAELARLMLAYNPALKGYVKAMFA